MDENLHEHAKITAIDISASALALYRRHNPKAEAVKHASIFDLPFADETFDGAYNLGRGRAFSCRRADPGSVGDSGGC